MIGPRQGTDSPKVFIGQQICGQKEYNISYERVFFLQSVPYVSDIPSLISYCSIGLNFSQTIIFQLSLCALLTGAESA